MGAKFPRATNYTNAQHILFEARAAVSSGPRRLLSQEGVKPSWPLPQLSRWFLFIARMLRQILKTMRSALPSSYNQ
jgi:hypothetical protein